MPTTKNDSLLEFLNAVTPRVGTANAIGLLKDAQMGAIRELLVELGISPSHLEEVFEKHLKQTAQNILKMSVPSPIQPNK